MGIRSSRPFGIRAGLKVIAVASLAVAALESPGCGGVTSNTGGRRDGGAYGPYDGGFGAFGGGAFGGGSSVGVGIGVGRAGTGPIGRPPTGTACGNGVVDPGETCDGANLGGNTCTSATMGLAQAGPLRCTPSCLLDTSACVDTRFGTGGRFGMGGAGGGAGAIGAGGMSGTPPAACYAMLGVPSPRQPTTCLQGQQATQACIYDYQLGSSGNSNLPTCGAGCGCSACAAPYAQCATTAGCIPIVECAGSHGCTDSYSCYKMGCAGVIDAVGLGSLTGSVADSAMRCMTGSACQLSCPQPVPLDRG